ncbi:MAG: DNA-3-methyladenine glycosylase family protein [Candidatus Binataceae bacterium]
MKTKASGPAWAIDAQQHLQRADQVMARIIEQVGPVQITRRPARFEALARAIIFQQLAGRAAQTIFDRFVAQVGTGRFPTPEQVVAAPEETMRMAGLSRGKISYLRDLAAHVRDDTLNFRRFPRMDDEAVITDLTRVRGIGRWTAEMFLMFNLCRPDVLAVDDLGLRNAATKAYAAKSPVGAKELREMGEPWRPYRTAAAWYLWQSLRIVTPDGSGAKSTAVTKPKSPAKPRTRTAKAKR